MAFLKESFSIDEDKNFIVTIHNDEDETSKIYEIIPPAELLISYIELNLTLNIDANDAVNT